jgi:fluoride exporter
MPDGSVVTRAVPLRKYRRAIRRRRKVLAAIAAGGAIGAVARYALTLALPTGTGHFPWGTFITNVSGCAALGLLVVILEARFPANRYLRPFLATGVIGAYTTFSTYAVEADVLVRDGHPGIAAAYIMGSVIAGLIAVWLGIVAGRAIVGVEGG